MNRLILNGLINCPETHFHGTNGPVNGTSGGSLDTIHRTLDAFRNVSGIEGFNFLII
jgi:hypothetical protein